MAVPLSRPEAFPREIVCDTDGGVCNFWRGIQTDPDEVAFWADYPTIHQDLTARHRWLINWVLENKEQLENDPEYYDARAAGWWVWGISIWIGGGWCQPDYRNGVMEDGRPSVQPHDGGKGVSVQRNKLLDARMPHIGNSGGMGVSAQRKNMPSPKRSHITSHNGGLGVSAQRTTRPDLLEYFYALADRLKKMVILNRSWESAVTVSVLQQTDTGPKPHVGIFLDPPYLTASRSSDIYGSDAIGESDKVARQTFEWAVEHGNKYRIAYCCHEGDFEIPEGWDSSVQSFGGIRDKKRTHKRDMVIYSPACLRKIENMSLFEE